MTESYWRTKSGLARRARLSWPSPGQWLRQLGLIVLVGMLWGTLLAGYLWLTAGLFGEQAASNPGSELAAAASVDPPTATPTTTPTPTATLTDTPAPAASPTPDQTGLADDPAPTASQEPLVTPTGTSTPLPTSTETPIPPTDTPAPLSADPPPADPPGAEVSFKADVLPIFERRCVKCHGGEKTNKGLVLKSHAGVLAGSWDGPVIEPGSAADSFLIEQIVTGKMPKKEPHLLPGEIEIISAWIDAGAPDN